MMQEGYKSTQMATLSGLSKEVAKAAQSTQQAHVSPEEAPQKQASPGSWKILSVDDDMVNHQVLIHALGKDDFNITEVMDGFLAVEYIEECKKTPQPETALPDAILLDLMMPGMSGLDVLAELRKTYHPLQLPIIIVTAKSSTVAAVNGFTQYCNDWVQKPFDRQELAARVRMHIHLKELAAKAASAVPRAIGDQPAQPPKWAPAAVSGAAPDEYQRAMADLYKELKCAQDAAAGTEQAKQALEAEVSRLRQEKEHLAMHQQQQQQQPQAQQQPAQKSWRDLTGFGSMANVQSGEVPATWNNGGKEPEWAWSLPRDPAPTVQPSAGDVAGNLSAESTSDARASARAATSMPIWGTSAGEHDNGLRGGGHPLDDGVIFSANQAIADVKRADLSMDQRLNALQRRMGHQALNMQQLSQRLAAKDVQLKELSKLHRAAVQRCEELEYIVRHHEVDAQFCGAHPTRRAVLPASVWQPESGSLR